MISKVIIIVHMFLGVNVFWALLRAHFNFEITLSGAQNICVHISIVYLVSLYL